VARPLGHKGRRPLSVALFLGAGASAPFGYPLMAGLYNAFLKQVEEHEHYLLRALQGYQEDNVETLLQSIDLVTEIAESPAASILEDARFTIRRKRTMRFHSLVTCCRSLRDKIEETIFELYRFRPACKSSFPLYSKLFSFIREFSAASQFDIYTTNYDRIMEEFLMQAGEYRLIDGFEVDPRTKRMSWSPESLSWPTLKVLTEPAFPVYLFKLHGSLNWMATERGIEQMTKEIPLTKRGSARRRNLLIYPGKKQPPEEEPFKTLYDHFETAMKTRYLCLVIGYSFRDPYLNRIFRNYLRSPPEDRTLVVMSPDCTRTTVTNLFGLGDIHDIPSYAKENLVLIPRRFGEGDWFETLQSWWTEGRLPSTST